MTFLLIAATWISLLAVIVGMCLTARAGDSLRHAPVHVHAGEGPSSPSTPVEAGEIVVHSRAGAPADAADQGMALAYRDGVAA